MESFYPLKNPRPWPIDAAHPGRPANEDKTVLFLGAGASFHEIVPIQSRLLECASAFCAHSRTEIDLPKDWAEIAEFLERLAPGVPIAERSLEDCLTFLDKADVAQEVVAGTGPKNSRGPRRALLNCIGNVLDASQDGTLKPFLNDRERAAQRADSPMTRLGRFLTTRANLGERDRWSVVSTNWDTTLDRAFGRGPMASVVDYCTYHDTLGALLQNQEPGRRRRSRRRSIRMEASPEATYRQISQTSWFLELALVSDLQSTLRQSDLEHWPAGNRSQRPRAPPSSLLSGVSAERWNDRYRTPSTGSLGNTDDDQTTGHGPSQDDLVQRFSRDLPSASGCVRRILCATSRL